MDGPVNAARRRSRPLERPGRARLDEAQRREGAEFRADDQRPVAIGLRGAAGQGQRGKPGRHEEKAAHVDNLEEGEQGARPACKARRRIAKETTVPLREPAFKGWRRLHEEAAGQVVADKDDRRRRPVADRRAGVSRHPQDGAAHRKTDRRDLQAADRRQRAHPGERDQ